MRKFLVIHTVKSFYFRINLSFFGNYPKMTEKNDQDLAKEHLEETLPHNCVPLSHQVAGHFHGKRKIGS